MALDKAKQTWKIYKDVITKKYKRIVWISSLIAEYLSLESLGLKPEIVVAGIPIYNLQAIGHASSDEILKYRAMGGIFLAHQKGGKKTFRFTAYITGGERFLYYKLLELLQIYGTESLRGINTENLQKSADLLYADRDLKIPEIPAELIESKADIYSFPAKKTISEQEYIYHRTFPIITDSKIYTSMYLETLIMIEDINLGKNTIEVDCAFRHFEAPTHFRTSKEDVKSTKQVIETVTKSDGTTKKVLVTKEITPTKKFYTTYTPYKDSKAWRNIENMLSLGWVSKRIPYEFADMTKKERGKFFVDLTNLATSYTFYNVLNKVKYPSQVPKL